METPLNLCEYIYWIDSIPRSSVHLYLILGAFVFSQS